jgi:hypothetical protein
MLRAPDGGRGAVAGLARDEHARGPDEEALAATGAAKLRQRGRPGQSGLPAVERPGPGAGRFRLFHECPAARTEGAVGAARQHHQGAHRRRNQGPAPDRSALHQLAAVRRDERGLAALGRRGTRSDAPERRHPQDQRMVCGRRLDQGWRILPLRLLRRLRHASDDGRDPRGARAVQGSVLERQAGRPARPGIKKDAALRRAPGALRVARGELSADRPVADLPHGGLPAAGLAGLAQAAPWQPAGRPGARRHACRPHGHLERARQLHPRRLPHHRFRRAPAAARRLVFEQRQHVHRRSQLPAARLAGA